MSYDIKIINGAMYDGTGADPWQANVAIKDGKIVEIGACEGPADKVIDAAGKIVTPGFLDIHTHFDGQISWDADLQPSVNHGVTTAIMGSCGVGFAPVRAEHKDVLIDLMEGIEDIPGTALAEGITWGWESFAEYMDIIDFPHTIDFGVQVPHDALRLFVMQDRALKLEDSTDEDIAAMRDHVAEALAAGAVGFSTGRTDNHRNIDGSPTPASEADARELAGIAEAFNGFSHGVLQAVSDFDMVESPKRFDEEFDLLEGMAAAAPKHNMSISLMQRGKNTEQWRQMLKRGEQAQEKGLDIRFQVGARGIGVMLGLEATFHPFMGFPSYKAISHLSLEERVAKMNDPAFKAQILSEKSEPVAGDGSNIPPIADEFLAHLDFVSMRLYRFHDEFDYEPEPTESILAESMRRKCTPLEAIFDAMLEDEGRNLLYFPIYNYLEQNLNAVEEMLNHPLALPASDAGAHVGTICDASMPTYLLTHWTRDRKRGGKLEVSKVIKMLTSDIANFLGLEDRGTLKVGGRADVNVIDYDNLRLFRPKLVADLPAGGQRLLQGVEGYAATICKGQLILENDELTGARPGRLLRMGQ